jgi:hypothetical protein
VAGSLNFAKTGADKRRSLLPKRAVGKPFGNLGIAGGLADAKKSQQFLHRSVVGERAPAVRFGEAAVVIRPRCAARIATRGKSGAYRRARTFVRRHRHEEQASG